MMNQRERDSLDRYITGNYGADSDRFDDGDGFEECVFCGNVVDPMENHYCREMRDEASIRRGEERHDEGY